MNREIKFRAWNPNWDEMVYSSLETVFDKRGFYPFGFEVGFSHYPTDEWTIMQYTGLKDKNGKEIYEGDIIEKIYYSYHQPECSEIFKIIYNGLGFSFEHIKGRFYHTPFTEEIEVIGNIHDNPELIKEEKQ